MNHNLDQIKQDYQNIKVPETLKHQVEFSIRQAKSDMEKSMIPERLGQNKWSVIRSWTARGCIGVAAAAIVLTILVNSSASIAYAMEQIPLLGNIVKVVTFREYEHQDNQMEANIKIPHIQIEGKDGEVIENATRNVNDSIQAYTDQIIAAYEADVKSSGGEGVQEVNVDYEVVTDNDRLFSLQFHQTVIMAGANQSEKIYHIDKKTGNMITIKDIFKEGADYKTAISENIKEQMKTQMEQDDSKIYWLNSETPEWDFKEISDTVNFYINEAGKLVIVFDEYEVAPGYMGVVSFEIPTDVVSSIVQDGYLL